MKTDSPTCHGPNDGPATHDQHAHHGGGHEGRWRLAAHSTLHCLTGCIIGEIVGLAIGIGLALGTTPTIALATILSYVSGFALGLLPVMRSRGVSLLGALKIIWIGEVISIGVMEVVMNAVDYQMGGMNTLSFFSWSSIRGLMFAVPAGFLAAWPVNVWLLGRNLKGCH